MISWTNEMRTNVIDSCLKIICSESSAIVYENVFNQGFSGRLGRFPVEMEKFEIICEIREVKIKDKTFKMVKGFNFNFITF